MGVGIGETSEAGVILRPLVEADLPPLHAWYQDPELSTHLVDDIPARAADEAIGFMRGWLAHDPANVRLAVVRAGDGGLLGRTALIEIADGSAELHLFLGDPASRGRGFGRSAVEALLDRAFGPLGLREVRLQVLSSNLAARRLYAAAGFRETGVVHGGAVKRGAPVDVVAMAVAAGERPHR